MNEAQLFWDNSDNRNTGWWLRYRDELGNEQGSPIDGDEDTSIAILAASVAIEHPDRDGTIKVFRGEQVAGRITLRAGLSPDWRAL